MALQTKQFNAVSHQGMVFILVCLVVSVVVLWLW